MQNKKIENTSCCPVLKNMITIILEKKEMLYDVFSYPHIL